jgi:predicted nucleic acid-binding protein
VKKILSGKYVIDASVVLQFILQEGPIDQLWLSEALRQQERQPNQQFLFSTSLLPLEVANALRFNLPSQKQMHKAISRFNELPLTILPLSAQLVEDSLLMAHRLGTTVYDTSYHILALERGAVFVTADGDYYKKAQELGSVELVVGS